ENFASIIRFDFRDILSNTDEAEFGLIQHFYFKKASDNCNGKKDSESADHKSADCTPAGADECLTWVVKQKYFIVPDLCGAIGADRRNVLTTTVDFAGIAFLSPPRHFSPIVSRLRFRTSANSDLEWQLDYDTVKGRINASTLYLTHRFGNRKSD